MNFFAKQVSKTVMLERTAGKSLPESVANFVIGVERLSSGEDDAEQYFQQSIKANHVTFDAAWARALLEHLPVSAQDAIDSSGH